MEPGGLQSMGPQRVGHDLVTKTQNVKNHENIMKDQNRNDRDRRESRVNIGRWIYNFYSWSIRNYF